MSELFPDLVEPTELALIDKACDLYTPSHVFAMFSGGHDSLCATHLASQHPRFSGCVHINTTIGIEQTREFVRQTCREHGWPLKEYRPPISYEELVIERGFPGPAMHFKMFNRLKERCIRDLIREHKTHFRDRILLVSGCRKQESVRRFKNMASSINREGCTVWVNPIYEWDASNKHDYISQHKLKRNPVVDILCMSGECLCGAFAKPGELNEIRTFFPGAAQEIDRIAEKVKAAGQHCVWGTRPPGSRRQSKRRGLPLCSSCEFKQQELWSDHE